MVHSKLTGSGIKPMKRAAPASDVLPFPALRRWRARAWLERMPLIGRFFRRRPETPPHKRPRIPLACETLEVRSVPNDPFSMAQTALLGGVMVGLPVITPAQVLLHGWSGGLPTPEINAQPQQAQLPPADPRALEAYFLGLSVVPT